MALLRRAVERATEHVPIRLDALSRLEHLEATDHGGEVTLRLTDGQVQRAHGFLGAVGGPVFGQSRAPPELEDAVLPGGIPGGHHGTPRGQHALQGRHLLCRQCAQVGQDH